MLAKGHDIAVRPHPDVVRLQLSFGNGGVGERHVMLLAELAVGHGTVAASNRSCANRKWLDVKLSSDVIAALGLQRERWSRVKALRLRLVQSPPLPPHGPLSFLYPSSSSSAPGLVGAVVL